MRRFVAWLVAFAAIASAIVVAKAEQAQNPNPPAELTALVESTGAHPGGTIRAALRVQLPPGLHAQSNKPRDPLLIPTSLAFTPPAGVTVTEVVFPHTIDVRLASSDQPLAVFEGDFVIGVQIQIDNAVAPGPIELTGRLRYQACNDVSCFTPRTLTTSWTLHVVAKGAATTRAHADVFRGIKFGTGEKPSTAPAAATPTPAPPTGETGGGAKLDNFEIRGSAGGYMSTAEFLRFIHNAEAGVKEKGLFEGRGPLAILLVVFLGGLALNLTPCVLPMIPINLAIIGAGTQAGNKSRGFWLGAVYGSAMALVYGVIGVVVILTAGTFGTINSSPWFNLGIAILFILLALAMFDVIVIDFSKYSSSMRFSESSRGTFLLAFVMGAVAALLAGACVAPVVIQVVLFASNLYSTGTKIALALPFLLGLGMAIPWPIAGAGLAALPKPGMWMVRVKQVFGVFILLTALYYGYEAYQLFANRWVDPASVKSSVAAKLQEGWYSSIDDGLAVAARDRKPVLVDLWATWCKNCLTMDKTTMEDPAVKSALSRYVKIKYQAEDPDVPETKRVMQTLGAIGLPTYVILQMK